MPRGLTSFFFCDTIKQNLFPKGTFTMAREAYPRPELVRESWTSLCGAWEFEFDFGRSGRERGLPQKSRLERTINVPFCPESELSGIGCKDFIPAVWYLRTFSVTKEQLAGRVLLHFGAVDQQADVFLNGEHAASHAGGYLPFCCEIKDAAPGGKQNAGPGAKRAAALSRYSVTRTYTKRGWRAARACAGSARRSGIWRVCLRTRPGRGRR